jgi:hypothetical protein
VLESKPHIPSISLDEQGLLSAISFLSIPSVQVIHWHHSLPVLIFAFSRCLTTLVSLFLLVFVFLAFLDPI